MLVSQSDFIRLGAVVVYMLEHEDTPLDFWLISDKIIDRLLNTKGMATVHENVKEEAKFNARIKLHANIRKFSPTRWHQARADRGQKPLQDHNKGVYEFVCLVSRNSILNTLTATTRKAATHRKVEMFDLADPYSKVDTEAVDLEITKYWLDRKLASQGVTNVRD